MTGFMRMALVLTLVGGLSGCSSNPSDGVVSKTVLAAASGLLKPKVPRPKLNFNRADIEAANQPLILVNLPDRDLESVLPRAALQGDVETWATNDGTTVTLRNGVLISTRALLPDLMSAAVPTVAQLLASGGSHSRSYVVLGADDASERSDYTCSMASLGPVRLEIVGKVHPTVHMQETCTGSAGKIVNDFWIERGSAIVRSRQWTNADVGYMLVDRLAG